MLLSSCHLQLLLFQFLSCKLVQNSPGTPVDGLETINEPDPDDRLPAIETSAVSVSGDLWQLGKHRVLCGNSLISENYMRLVALTFHSLSLECFLVALSSSRGRFNESQTHSYVRQGQKLGSEQHGSKNQRRNGRCITLRPPAVSRRPCRRRN
jgi:hypothetical protein